MCVGVLRALLRGVCVCCRSPGYEVRRDEVGKASLSGGVVLSVCQVGELFQVASVSPQKAAPVVSTNPPSSGSFL